MNTCNSNHYGNVSNVVFVKNYKHIMSRKIRVHLYKKQFELLGIENPLKAAEEYTSNKNY